MYASLWKSDGVRLWTLVNRNAGSVSGALLKVPSEPGHRYFDLITGREALGELEGEHRVLCGDIKPRGIGCYVSASDKDLGADFAKFLDGQSRVNARCDFDTNTPRRETRLISAPLAAPEPRHAEGMIPIPAVTFNSTIVMRSRECGYDMCGNVWQWTESERSDGRTRFCMIRGGSYFTAKGSRWHMDGGPRPANFAAKFLMTWPGLDRCATLGFRCVADLPSDSSP